MIPAADLEVAVLDRTRTQPRKFKRLREPRLARAARRAGPPSDDAAAGRRRGGADAADRADTDDPADPTDQVSGGTPPLEDPLTGEPAGRSQSPPPSRRRSHAARSPRPVTPAGRPGRRRRRRIRPRRRREPACHRRDDPRCGPRLGWDMDRRIFGIENEYGVTCTFKGQRRLSPDEVARYLFRKVVSWGRSSNVFLRNGARLYLDVGSHPEYATPECDDIAELVTHDKAGERILEGLLLDAEQRLHDEGIAGDIYLFKNNTDSAGNSYGCHENYLVGRAGEFSQLADILIPFLVTRQIVVGAGKVTQTPARRDVLRLASAPSTSGRASPAPPRAAGRSSTPATSRTPTPRSTAGCTSSSATPT